MSQKNYKNKKNAASQVKTKQAPVAEAPVVAAEPTVTEAAPQAEIKTDWKPIIKDFFILLIIMGVLGYACNLLKDAFAPKSPTDSLVSLIRKGDVKDVKGEEIDEPFLKEIKNGKEKDSDFINTRDSNARTPLMWTAYANFNDPEKAEETDINRIYYLDVLFANGANIHAVDADGFNALHWAAWSGMRFISYKLVKKGVDINQPEYNGYTPLMLAAMRGNATVVDLLLKMGANPAVVNKDNLTAAQLAANAELAYKKRDSWIYGPVFSDNREQAYLKTCKLLAENKGKISDDELSKLEVELEMEMLASQAESRAERKIAELAKKDETRAAISLIPLVSLNEADIDLHHRVKAEAEAIVAMEKEHAVEESALHKTDDAGNTALHIAAKAGKTLCCYHLLNVGADITKKNKEGKTPLMLAVLSGHIGTVEVLAAVDKKELKKTAEETLKMMEETTADIPHVDASRAVLLAVNPTSLQLKNLEFEIRREAADKAYAKAKAEAAAKAKAEAEAAAKAAEEARAKAAAEAKAREDALALAEKTAESRIAEAEKAIKHAHDNSAMAVKAMIAADLARVEAEQAKLAADTAAAEAQKVADSAAAAEKSAAAVEAEAKAAIEAANAAKAEAVAAKAAADAAKAEAEVAKSEAEAIKAAAEAAVKAATENAPVAPVAEQPAA